MKDNPILSPIKNTLKTNIILNLLMALNIMEILVNKVKDIIKDNKLGLTVLNLSLRGFKIFDMDPVFSLVPMDLLSKVFGIKESSKDMENIMEKMVLMKETGDTINLTDSEFKLGKMEVNFKEIITKALNTEMENIHGLINQFIKETGNKAKFVAKEFIFIMMAEFMKAHLKIIKWKEKEHTLGQMEESTSDYTRKTRNMD